MANAHVIRVRIGDVGEMVTAAASAYTTMTGRMARALRSAWCTLNGGHYKVLHTEPTRLALKCVACGHTTPGWEVGGLRLATRYAAHQEPLRLVKPAKRVA